MFETVLLRKTRASVTPARDDVFTSASQPSRSNSRNDDSNVIMEQQFPLREDGWVNKTSDIELRRPQFISCFLNIVNMGFGNHGRSYSLTLATWLLLQPQWKEGPNLT